MTGNDLREARNRMGLNQTEVAKMLGISYPTYSSYENNGKIPNTKFGMLQKFIDQSNEIHETKIINEENEGYKIFNSKSDLDIKLDLIFNELKSIRKENEQLKNTITHFIENSEKEQKINKLSRTQLKLAIDIIRNMDDEIEDLNKSSSAKQSLGKVK